MSVFIAALLVQYVISVKAGLVNHVQGTTNVKVLESVRAGHSVKTGPDGYVEILLRPGSFLRLGEDSEASLDDTDLSTVKVTIVRGPAIVEAGEISKERPITITTGNLTTKIIESGIYRFEKGVATVLAGKLQTADAKLSYEKGWQIFFQDNYRARKTGKMQETSLDVYSQTRSGAIASANFSMVTTLNGSPSYNSFDVWLFSPNLGFYTYIPGSNYRSPYGYRYYGVGNRDNRVYGNNGGTDSASNGTNTNSTAAGNSNNSGGGAAPAPAPIVSTPSGEQSSPATYVDSKNSSVGATVR